ncbi:MULTISPECIES: (2Fe-2S)-binding protein [Cupriavidus]|uniref:(2Fe-2S)-binding protein n=1 Tax=Cupriavidus pauculus TaxID=82633 RepID=A0A3G8H8Q0_9BURK|nr:MULTISPECIES: (2Fe-2S)-binding protein [Cupriavidus]AZG16778.1 (2Fe-2S)-binding protein [Cupriavidus pauculus]MDT6961382.1 (2Fe-2S)-binding protein [Cupriavidus sp. SZY C1]
MFRRIDAAEPAGRPVRLTVDGVPLACREGDSVAAALFAAGVLACRDTAVSGAARGPYCMMGVCYDCLVRIDGRPNQQACMTRVRDGMRVERQIGAREVAA